MELLQMLNGVGFDLRVTGSPELDAPSPPSRFPGSLLKSALDAKRRREEGAGAAARLPVAALQVRGAGLAEANGRYVPRGVRDGVARYEDARSGYEIFRRVIKIVEEEGEGGGGATQQRRRWYLGNPRAKRVFYFVPCSTVSFTAGDGSGLGGSGTEGAAAVPPLEGWRLQGDSPPPAPTVRAIRSEEERPPDPNLTPCEDATIEYFRVHSLLVNALDYITRIDAKRIRAACKGFGAGPRPAPPAPAPRRASLAAARLTRTHVLVSFLRSSQARTTRH